MANIRDLIDGDSFFTSADPKQLAHDSAMIRDAESAQRFCQDTLVRIAQLNPADESCATTAVNLAATAVQRLQFAGMIK